ncbi:MAG: PEPxxWA-CTERM sorting domain-containing protein [Parasphingorhabdus sp.]|uniref:PEPxxWA-CTERM sorting domain-containing protein n=1 Tax=Parasphingorhabdus sp. TaxID=2709688 RepID=UPI003001D32E
MKFANGVKYALLASIIAVAMPANAQNILYRNDFNLGTDYFDQAITSSAFTATRTAGDLSSFTLSDFDAVFYANQNSGAPAGDIAALASYISGGGRVIFNNWLADSPPLDSTFTGNNNQTVLTLTQFTSGVASPLSVVNPGWGTFSAGLMATAGGTVAATFENGDAAIVIGNGGRSIHNGFLTDTVDSSQLYANQFSFLFGSAGAVPEPATWALMLFGFAFAGASLRRRKNKVTTTVSYA